jgi:hypothetical protein
VNLLRRGSPAPDNDEDTDSDDDGDEVAVVATKSQPSSEDIERKQKELIRKQKSADRSSYQELRRQAAKATSGLQDPEPRRGIYVGIALGALAVLSYFGQDLYPKVVTSHHKSVTEWLPITHPEAAIILFVVAVGAAVSTYWRRRYVSGVAFFVAGVAGMDTPYPKGLSDLQYLVFAIGAGYFLWVIMFRMNKQKKEWIAEHTPKASRSGSSSGATTSSARQSQRKKSGSAKAAAPAARTRKAKADAPVLSATGRALPPSNGRYTRPRGTSRASQRRS